MNLKIKLIDTSLPKPKYQTKGAVAFDIYSRIPITINPKSTAIIPMNIVVKVPKNHMLMIAGRSSLPKKGLMVANSVGIIDQDYCGDKDELGLFVYNFSHKKVLVEKGERLAQCILIKISKAKEITIVQSMKKKSRGGFGSTGKK